MEYDKSERKEYLEAAHRLRMPYWDWISEEAASHGEPTSICSRDQCDGYPTPLPSPILTHLPTYPTRHGHLFAMLLAIERSIQMEHSDKLFPPVAIATGKF